MDISGGQTNKVIIDDFLFSDDDDGPEKRVINPVVAPQDEDIVPDSSDEASTGPALDMDLDSFEENGARETRQDVTMDQDTYAHASASSGTRQAFKTSHMDHQHQSATINPRELTVNTAALLRAKTPESRDSDAPSSALLDTSVATTEVIPSQHDDVSSVKTISPGDRPPHMLGKQLLQPKVAENAADAVKIRQRPRAKPLVLATKEQRAAVRGESPPRKSTNSSSSILNKSSRRHSEDEDDELRLKLGKAQKSEERVQGSTEQRKTKENKKKSTSASAISLDSDDDLPPAKPSLVTNKKTASTSSKKGKHRADPDETDSDDNLRQDAGDDDLLEEIMKANAKESEDDDDYDGKAASKDKWSKKGKKKPARRSSKAPSEEPAPKVSARPARTKGRPSAVFPSSKKSKLSIVDTNDEESDEPIPVGARKTSSSKASKKEVGTKEKGRASKGPEPRSKEFLDDEDMEDDVPAFAPSKTASDGISKASKLTGSTSEIREETAPPPPSSDAPIPTRSKPTKTYGKKGSKPVSRIEESEDEDENARDKRSNLESTETILKERSQSLTKDDQKERSSSKDAVNNRSKRSESPAYAVVIDNSAKKSKAPTSKSSLKATANVKPVEQSTVVQAKTSKEIENDTPSSTKKSSESKKRKAAGRIADSEEEDAGDESSDTEENVALAQKDRQVKQAQGAMETTRSQSATKIASPPKKAVNKTVLQTKDANSAISSKSDSDAHKIVAAGASTAAPILSSKASLTDVKPILSKINKPFHNMVVAKGGGQGIRSQGLSKRGKIPSLLSHRGVPPPKKPPLPPAPVRKKKKGEEVYSDDDQEELKDQPEEWWEREDFYEWEQRKRKRAKARGELDSEDEKDFAKQQKKSKKENTAVLTEPSAATELEHFSD